jgi:hypothetical protein
MPKTPKHKFEFGTDFQELILQYTLTDPKGYKVLSLYEDSYFTLIPHSIIAYALKKYYKKEKHLPEEPILRESLRTIYQVDKVMKLNLTNEDKQEVDEIIKKLYSSQIKHPEPIVKKIISFARYVKFKDKIEQIDINNYDEYEKSLDEIRKSINVGIDLENNYGTPLIGGMKDRAHKRDSIHEVHHTPWWQFDKLLNSGGTETGNVIVILSKEKQFKTGALINVARGYMMKRKKGVYFDLENGETAITVRGEQSLINEQRSTIQSGELDKKLLKLCRRYARIGAELYIKKFPSLKTTTDDYRAYLDLLKRDFDYEPDFIIVDYGLLQGATTGKLDDTARISDAFLDLKNLADDYGVDALWTAAHTTREGNKRLGSKFLPTDTAKCMDITKHIDCLLGLQQSEEEEKGGVIRMEILEQRGGIQGKMLFWVDIPRQRMKEFSKSEVKAYMDQLGNKTEEELKTNRKKKSDL